MALRRLSTLNFPTELKEKLCRSNLKTVEDALSKAPLELMNVLRISSQECCTLRNYLFTLCMPRHLTAHEVLLLGNAAQLPFGQEVLDGLLAGGLHVGTVNELTGPAGVGKTQFCIHLAVRCVLSDPNASVVYIDTESAFRPERFLEILLEKTSDLQMAEELLSRIFVFKPYSVSSLSKILDSLEMEVLEKSVRLVIVDSVTSLARKELNSGLCSSSRSEVLARWAALLKSVAQKMNVTVILTNQVTTHTNSESNLEDDRLDGYAIQKAFTQVTPALGIMWFHFVNSRFILQYTDGDCRQFLIAKSPIAPVAAFNFFITKSGVEFKGNGMFTNKGLDFSQHGIRVQKGINLLS